MYLNATNKDKLVALADFHDELFAKIERELKNDHLKKDPIFQRKYFGKNSLKPTRQEIVEGYFRAAQEEEQGETIAEYVLQRWMLKEGELYNFFEKKLSAISDDFTTLTSLDAAKEKALIDDAEAKFGPLQTYLFAVVNSVCFSPETFAALKKKSLHEKQVKQRDEATSIQSMTETKTIDALNDTIRRLQDKYEKKLEGIERKYFIDTEALKKQIAKLQSRLALIEKK